MPRSLLAIAVLTLSALVSLAPAQSDPLAGFDDPVGQLNALLPRVPDDQRADLILGRALSETDPMPAALEALDSIRLLVPGDGEWDAALAWATGDTQKAALEAFVTATDRRARNVFALPYGEAAPADLRAEGFSVGFVDGKLYEMEPGYFEHLSRLDALVWIEANRLVEAGEGMEAAELMASMVRLGRMLADRPMLWEAMLGYGMMLDSCEQLRDLVYRSPKMIGARESKRITRLLEDRTLRLDRLLFPPAGEIAVKQAIIDVYGHMGEADVAKIDALVAGSMVPDGWASEGEPWGYFKMIDAAERVFGDWRLRWPLDQSDIILDRPSYYTSLLRSGGSGALVLAVAKPHDMLFEMRRLVRAELAGTKLSLGVAAYANDFGSLPKPLVAIRPAYVSEIDVDPFDPLAADLMRYFVPIRDQSWGPTETPHPHTIRVHVSISGEEQFASLIESPMQRLVDDERAVASMRAFIASITSRGFAVQNIREKLDGMNEETLRTLIPEHFRTRTNGLGAEGLRDLNETVIVSMLTTPDYKTFADAWGESPDTGSRRRRGSRRQAEPSRELTQLARSYAVALAEFGVPQARRLKREEHGDPNVAMFDVTLDDSDFVLYSVGDDATPDWAEQSGLDGEDILYWPPVLSLYREHTGG